MKAKPFKMSSINVSKAENLPENSIWLNVKRIPKKMESFKWEHVEDISDDDNDTPQAAGKRLSKMKFVRDQIRQRAYAHRLIELQNAGLFLKWSKPLPLSYRDKLEYAYPIWG